MVGQISISCGCGSCIIESVHEPIFYHMVKTGESYQEKGADYFTTINKEKIQRRLVRQLERLGNTVSLQPQDEGDLA